MTMVSRFYPLPIRPKNVNGTQADGSADAERNADDLITTFGADYLASLSGELYMFLDVEGRTSLSQAYYTGWAQTLVAHSDRVTNGLVKILPCVYATRSDNATWSSVAGAAATGVQCNGAWIARWLQLLRDEPWNCFAG
jgi:hypothetical protein